MSVGKTQTRFETRAQFIAPPPPLKIAAKKMRFDFEGSSPAIIRLRDENELYKFQRGIDFKRSPFTEILSAILVEDPSLSVTPYGTKLEVHGPEEKLFALAEAFQ